jgi:HK97 family phage portal protein
MKLFGFDIRREKRNAEDPRIPVSAENFLALFGVTSLNLPPVTVDNALTVPAVAAAVNFLSSSMANLPLHVYRSQKDASERAGGSIQKLLNEAPNPEWSSFAWRKYFWQQVFTGGRGLSWIERNEAGNPLAIWPMDPSGIRVEMTGGRRVYRGETKQFAAADVIDIPFMLKRDMIGSYSPIALGAKAIQLALAMNDYASNFFAGGGVPPLALSGPLPQGADAMKRAMNDIHRAIDSAKNNAKPIFPMPPGHELKPVGFEPEKGQMTDARRFQIEEIARIYSLPPVFLQDLTHGTFSNTEQQDLHLVKHLVAQWAKALEDELNLKLFGQLKNNRYVEHSLDGLQRGDFASRMTGLSQAIQNAIMTPNEARALENRQPLDNGDELLIQGATVPLGTQPADDPATARAANAAGDQPPIQIALSTREIDEGVRQMAAAASEGIRANALETREKIRSIGESMPINITVPQAPVPNIEVIVPAANVEVTVPVPEVHVNATMPETMSLTIDGMPERVTTSTITRDKAGNITKTTQTERDA